MFVVDASVILAWCLLDEASLIADRVIDRLLTEGGIAPAHWPLEVANGLRMAERRYGGVLDDEMLMATPPEFLLKAIEGMRALARNGFRYPFPQYGVQQDVRAGMAVSYGEKA